MRILPALAACGLAFSIIATSCEEDVKIGNSILQDDVQIVVDSSFTLSGRSVRNAAVQSRTITQLLGSLDAEGFGSLRSDVVTQFMAANALDTVGVTVNTIDSLKLILQIDKRAFTGDTLVPMGLDVYRLNKQLPSPIYSDFDPKDYYNSANLLGSATYTLSAINSSDTIQALDYRQIVVDMPRSLAQEFYSEYKSNPATFATPSAFTEYFPGVYLRNSFGSGRVLRADRTLMRMYYHRTYVDEDTGRDTTVYKIGNYFSVTPEVVTNNNISLNMSSALTSRVDNGEQLLVAPAGYDVTVTFPARELVAKYRSGNINQQVLNALSLKLPAERIANDYDIEPPTSVLMVLSSKKDKFFADNMLPDNKTSFVADYNSTTGTYVFSDMRDYMQYLLDLDVITDDDLTFTITPVSIITETSNSNYSYSYYYYAGSTGSQTYTNRIVPYISTPAMARLRFDRAKIILTYSKQSVIF